MLSTRLELEAETILDGIPDPARRSHADTVLTDTVTALRDHESRKPVADALVQVSKLMERVDTSRAVPVAQELAKIFGFETVAEFDAAWIEYVKSTAFK